MKTNRLCYFWMVLVFVGILSACDSSGDETAPVLPTVTLSNEAVDSTPSTIDEDGSLGVGTDSAETQPTTSTATSIDQLRVWLPPNFHPTNTTLASQLLLEQISLFEASVPTLAVDVQRKGITEQGGIFSYLQAGQEIAPSILPDLIIVRSDQLISAVEDGLVFPVDEEVLITDGLTPTALALATVNDTLYGYPFAFVDFYHLVYNSATVEEIIPNQWDGMARIGTATFTFAAEDRAGASLLLQLYESGGGSVNTVNGFELEEGTLAKALDRIQKGRVANFISADTVTTSSDSAAWSEYAVGDANIVLASATDFLTLRQGGNASQFAAIPGLDRESVPLVRGWVWAITTDDPERQQMAQQLINVLTSAENLGDWSQVANQLPTNPFAFNRWNRDDYTIFLQSQLQAALPFPQTLTSDGIDVLTSAINTMLISATTPATDTAADIISQLR